MTDAEKLSALKNQLGSVQTSDAVLSSILAFAGQKLCNRLYPYSEAQRSVPAHYEPLQIQIALELYSKTGAEGQTSHSENGIARAWECADISKSLLSEITPFVGVM